MRVYLDISCKREKVEKKRRERKFWSFGFLSWCGVVVRYIFGDLASHVTRSFEGESFSKPFLSLSSFGICCFKVCSFYVYFNFDFSFFFFPFIKHFMMFSLASWIPLWD